MARAAEGRGNTLPCGDAAHEAERGAATPSLRRHGACGWEGRGDVCDCEGGSDMAIQLRGGRRRGPYSCKARGDVCGCEGGSDVAMQLRGARRRGVRLRWGGDMVRAAMRSAATWPVRLREGRRRGPVQLRGVLQRRGQCSCEARGDVCG